MRFPFRRVLVLAALCTVVGAGLTVAAARESASAPSYVFTTAPLPTKTVPNVVGQPYVFAESMLQENGFGWKVVGKVAGWSEARVLQQSPSAGTDVVDTGAPVVELQLSLPEKTLQRGTPVNESPYTATKIMLPSGIGSSTSLRAAEQQTTTGATSTNATTASETGAAPKHQSKPVSSEASTRPRAFVIAGAKPEPLNEIPLPLRAERLRAWLDSHPHVTNAEVRYWLFQHAWIVVGAKFGWWHGAQALRILIGVDERAQVLWGIGAKSENEARQALEFVESRT
jgi:hypothetical protein